METLQYNTDREGLIIPEYGRHIHIMIQQVVEEKDREKRNKQAKAIIDVMGNLNPHLLLEISFIQVKPREASASINAVFPLDGPPVMTIFMLWL